jgi:hypothetical protein
MLNVPMQIKVALEVAAAPHSHMTYAVSLTQQSVGWRPVTRVPVARRVPGTPAHMMEGMHNVLLVHRSEYQK